MLISALVSLETMLKVPIFDIFDDFGHFFKLFVLVQGTDFLRKISSMYTLSGVVRDFFMKKISEPIINTMQTS